jgi:hypothetical protein
VGQFRVLLSAGNNTRRTSRGNTKSGVVGMWKSGKCHWCSLLGAQVGGRRERGGAQGGGATLARQCEERVRGRAMR